jgi:hypothetical protein
MEVHSIDVDRIAREVLMTNRGDREEAYNRQPGLRLERPGRGQSSINSTSCRPRFSYTDGPGLVAWTFFMVPSAIAAATTPSMRTIADSFAFP